MKRLIALSLALPLAVGLVGCSSSNTNTTSTPAPQAKSQPQQKEEKKPEQKPVTSAEDAVNALKASGLPIGKADVYTAENDPNQLLGRPGQYVGKVNFVDTDLKADDSTTSTTSSDTPEIQISNGGSVEMFATADDAQKRLAYVKDVTSSSPLLTEYDYASGKLVVRLSKQLTPDQAKKFEDALKSLPQ